MEDPHYDYEALDVPIEQVMVASAFTSTAIFDLPEGKVACLETRAYTVDGEEHHLIWPLPAALPLLQAIMHVSMAALGAPGEFASGDIPDDPDDINWNGDAHE